VNHEPTSYSWWSNVPAAWDRNLGWRIDYQRITPNLAHAVRATSIYRDERFLDRSPVTIDYDR
jgi:exodeoxyribonuclease-3